MGFTLPIDDVVAKMCIWYKLCLAQIVPQIWRLILCLFYLVEKASVILTFKHLLHLYSPKIYRG